MWDKWHNSSFTAYLLALSLLEEEGDRGYR
jgi:hypothetical protein